MSDISDEALEELKMCFDIFDRSCGKEIVPAKELQAMLQSMKLNPLTKDVNKILKDAELEGKDMDFPTFVSMYDQFSKRPTIATMNDMIEAFKTMDREGNGSISGAVLRNVVTIMGDAMSDQQYNDLLAPHEDKESQVQFEGMIKGVMAG